MTVSSVIHLWNPIVRIKAPTQQRAQFTALYRHIAAFALLLLKSYQWTSRGRRIAFSTLILFFSLALPCYSQGLDRYGGRKDIKCSAGSRAWRTEKIGDRWWICTPEGYAFFAQDVELIIPTDDVAAKRVNSKYGSMAAWSEATLERLKAWGFNTIGAYAHNITWPVITDQSLPADSKGHHVHTIKLPFLAETRPSFYSMTNPAIRLETGKEVRFLADPVKSILEARSPFYNGYVPGGGIGDYYDAKMQIWMNDDFVQNSAWSYIKNGPNNDFLMGVIGDDGDQMFGFANGSDFPTLPAGKNNPNLALLILAESPLQTANSDRGFVYIDTTMHTKKALRDMLESKYRTVSALNAAWGSNYNTFDSTGTQIAEEFVGTGDGSTRTSESKQVFGSDTGQSYPCWWRHWRGDHLWPEPCG
jgi:hypothetical protein